MKDMQHLSYRGVVSIHLTAMGTPAERGSGALTELEGELMLAEPVTKAKRPPMYKVTLLNDDFTPMDFVVTVIEHIFRKTHEEAVQLMLSVHEKGSAIVGVYTREVAETKVDQTVEYARINEHPLQCAMEPE
jgi:ATP-dependent Clp protease adaptor protein ClpS